MIVILLYYKSNLHKNDSDKNYLHILFVTLLVIFTYGTTHAQYQDISE